MILEHDTEPDVDVAIVNSYVTVAARNWCIVPIVVEATTTKDGPTLVLVYPNLIYKSKLFISFDFCFYFLVFLLFSSLYPHVLYARLTGVSASIGCKARHGTQCGGGRSANSTATVTVRNWVARPAVSEATTTKDGVVRCVCSF